MPYIGVSAGSRFSSGSYTTVEPPAAWNTNTGVLFEPSCRARRVRTKPSIWPASRCSRTTVASASMVGAVLTSSAVIGALGAFRKPLRPSSRRSSSSSSGSALKMPPGDLPVTIAHVANVTRSAASRGGTSEPSASVTACCVSTVREPAAAAVGLVAQAPTGLVGGGGIARTRSGPSAAAGSSEIRRRAPAARLGRVGGARPPSSRPARRRSPRASASSGARAAARPRRGARSRTRSASRPHTGSRRAPRSAESAADRSRTRRGS